MGEEQRPDFLADHLGRFGSQRGPGFEELGFDFAQGCFEFPALVVAFEELALAM